MATPIFELVNELPEKNLTTRLLTALDFAAPGQWRNLTNFEQSIKVITGESDESLVQQVGERAIQLYNDRSQGYQRAVWLYEKAESLSNVIGAAAMANKVGESFRIASLFSKITPKADTSQTVDFGVKLVIELVAYCMSNGLPGDSITDFAKSLTTMRDERLIRMAALICVDGILPLGPDYLSKIVGWMDKLGASELEENATFQRVKPLIPGGDTKEQLGFIQKSMSSVKDWMASFTQKHDLTPHKVLGSLKGFLDVADDRLDYVAAFIDLTCNYYEHTGIQSVNRALIERAINEV